MGIFRKIRGVVGNALVWAGAWFTAGMGLGAALHLGTGSSLPFWAFVLSGAVNVGTLGFVTGGAFALVLGVAGRKRTLDELSATQVGFAGALLAGVVVPGLLGPTIPMGLLPLGVLAGVSGASAVLGGLTAGISIKVAQSGSERLEGYPGPHGLVGRG